MGSSVSCLKILSPRSKEEKEKKNQSPPSTDKSRLTVFGLSQENFVPVQCKAYTYRLCWQKDGAELCC